ncbi:hypothetical protein CVCC1112_4314 [Paenarthrobacter nicotinovorans]|nr:hypothetical protein CVCC1112_4314 [Paenarthrobacter nicotinovorans]
MPCFGPTDGVDILVNWDTTKGIAHNTNLGVRKTRYQSQLGEAARAANSY